MRCAFRSYRWAARLSARLGSRIPQLPLDGTADSGTVGIASGHNRSLAKPCTKHAFSGCTFSADPGRRCCIRYGQHRPRSQQIYCEAMQHTQTLMLGCAAHSSAVAGRHRRLRHGSSRLLYHVLQVHKPLLSCPWGAVLSLPHPELPQVAANPLPSSAAVAPPDAWMCCPFSSCT